MLKSAFSGSWLTKLIPVDFDGSSSNNAGVGAEPEFSSVVHELNSAHAASARTIGHLRRRFTQPRLSRDFDASGRARHDEPEFSACAVVISSGHAGVHRCAPRLIDVVYGHLKIGDTGVGSVA